MSLLDEIQESWGENKEEMKVKFLAFVGTSLQRMEKAMEENLEKMKEELKVGNFGKASDYYQNYTTCNRSKKILNNFLGFILHGTDEDSQNSL